MLSCSRVCALLNPTTVSYPVCKQTPCAHRPRYYSLRATHPERFDSLPDLPGRPIRPLEFDSDPTRTEGLLVILSRGSWDLGHYRDTGDLWDWYGVCHSLWEHRGIIHCFRSNYISGRTIDCVRVRVYPRIPPILDSPRALPR